MLLFSQVHHKGDTHGAELSHFIKARNGLLLPASSTKRPEADSW
jgi:hypothetical protein